jgi:tRNA A58 N-methylase Trm61
MPRASEWKSTAATILSSAAISLLGVVYFAGGTVKTVEQHETRINSAEQELKATRETIVRIDENVKILVKKSDRAEDRAAK